MSPYAGRQSKGKMTNRPHFAHVQSSKPRSPEQPISDHASHPLCFKTTFQPTFPTGKAHGVTSRSFGGVQAEVSGRGLDFLEVALVWKFPHRMPPKHKLLRGPHKLLRNSSRSGSMRKLVLALSCVFFLMGRGPVLSRVVCFYEFGAFSLGKQGKFTQIGDLHEVWGVCDFAFICQGKNPELRQAPLFREPAHEAAILFGLVCRNDNLQSTASAGGIGWLLPL